MIVDHTFVPVAQEGEDKEDEKKGDNGASQAQNAGPLFPPPPLQLSVLLARRKLRALSRAYGFRGLFELIKDISFGCDVDALVFLKVGMRGKGGGRLRERVDNHRNKKRGGLVLAPVAESPTREGNPREPNSSFEPTNLSPAGFPLRRSAALHNNDTLRRMRSNESDTDSRSDRSSSDGFSDQHVIVPTPANTAPGNTDPSTANSANRDSGNSMSHHNSDSSSNRDLSNLRHHYLRGLESCPSPYLSLCTSNFQSLYTHIIALLGKALRKRAVGTAVVIMQRAMLDWEPRDHKAIVDWGIVELLTSAISIDSTIDNFLTKRTWETPRLWSVEGLRKTVINGGVGWDGVNSVVKQIAERMLDPAIESAALELFENVPPNMRTPSSLIKKYAKIMSLMEGEKGRQKHKVEEWKRNGVERRAKQDKKKRGVRFTYVVTASNGVGVRSLPHNSTTRTGKSYKCDEIAEVSYRFRLAGSVSEVKGESYLRLCDGGWLFDVGIRSPYKNKKIMKEIKCEEWNEWWEHWLEVEGKEIGGWSKAPGVELCHGGTTVVHRVLERVMLKGTSLLNSQGSNYFEITVRSGGTNNGVGVGIGILEGGGGGVGTESGGVASAGGVEVDGRGEGEDVDDEVEEIEEILPTTTQTSTNEDNTKLNVGGVKGTYGWRIKHDKYYAHGDLVSNVAIRPSPMEGEDWSEAWDPPTLDDSGVMDSANDTSSVVEEDVNSSMISEGDRAGMPSMLEVDEIDVEAHTETRSGDSSIVKIAPDTVYGCGVDFESGKVFFTKDGAITGMMESQFLWSSGGDHKLVPMVSLGGNHEVIEINHGSFGFNYKGSKVVVSEKCVQLGLRREKREEEDRERTEKAKGGLSEGPQTVRKQSPPRMKRKYANPRPEAPAFSSSIAADLSIAQFGTLSESAWDLFKLVTRHALNTSSNNHKIVKEVEVDEVDAICIMEQRRSRSESLYGSELEKTKDYTVKLQASCLTFLLEDIARATSFFLKEDIALKVEIHVHSRVDFLHEIGSNKACRARTTDPEFLTHLFILLDRGSPRIQSLVLEILGQVTPRLSVSLVDASLSQADEEHSYI